jgi:hypothetical protein
MNASVLLDKLTMIERSIGVQTNTAVRNLVLDAQDPLAVAHVTIVLVGTPVGQPDINLVAVIVVQAR